MKFGRHLVDNNMPLPLNFRWMNDGGDEDIELEAEEVSYSNLSLGMLCVGCVLCVRVAR